VDINNPKNICSKTKHKNFYYNAIIYKNLSENQAYCNV